jgi:hypothetical protein
MCYLIHHASIFTFRDLKLAKNCMAIETIRHMIDIV